MSCVDQSTQVNFPIVNSLRNKKRLQRYNTAQELWSRAHPHNGSNTPKTNHSKPKNGHSNLTLTRPRSLILHTSNLHPAIELHPSTGPNSRVVTPISKYDETHTPDASTISINSSVSNRETQCPYNVEVTHMDEYRKWNAPISTYNMGKAWRYNTMKGPSGNDQIINPHIEPGGYPDYHCSCSQVSSYNRVPNFSNSNQGVRPKEPKNAAQQSEEDLSWRRLHMSRAKLKATATTSELLSGFAMIAMVELQINEPTEVPEWLFVLFSVCTTVLVAVHIFALMISTYLLPNIEAISKLEESSLVNESPHERMRGFIELAYAFSTVFGLFLFLVEIAILCWVKFWDFSFVAAIAATVIVIPVLCIFVAFAIHFYHSSVTCKYESTNVDMEQLEAMKRKLDNATSPV